MNCIEIIQNILADSFDGLETYYKDEQGNIYEFYKPGEHRYQGEQGFYRNVKTGEIKEIWCEHGIKKIKLKKEELL